MFSFNVLGGGFVGDETHEDGGGGSTSSPPCEFEAEIDDLAEEIEGLIADGWEEAFQKIAMQIALRAYKMQSSVVVFEHWNYRGRSQMFSEGVYTANSSDLCWIKNDAISSMKIPEGYAVQACRHERNQVHDI